MYINNIGASVPSGIIANEFYYLPNYYKLYIDDMENTLGKYGIIVWIGSTHDRCKIKMDDGNCWWL